MRASSERRRRTSLTRRAIRSAPYGERVKDERQLTPLLVLPDLCITRTRSILSAMERVPLMSRAVLSAGYDAETRVLEVEFSSGHVYRFTGVPAGVYEWLRRVPNKGIYVARNITGRYDYEDVTRASATDDAVDLQALLEASLSGGSNDV